MAWTPTLLARKAKALATHLTISAVLVGGAFYLMLTRWFPAPLFGTDGYGMGPKLLVAVDLILGPLLTFVVFDPAKSRRQITFDLGTIALAQLLAFGYGLHTIHQVRIGAVAWYEGQFQAVSASAFKEQQIKPEDWQRLGTGEPYLVNVRKAETPDEANGVMAFGFMSSLSPYQLAFLYDPYAPSAQAHWEQGWTLAELKAQHPTLASAAAHWLQRHDEMPDHLRFFRVSGFYDNAVMVLDDEGRWRGGFAGQLPVKPLPASSSSSPAPSLPSASATPTS